MIDKIQRLTSIFLAAGITLLAASIVANLSGNSIFPTFIIAQFVVFLFADLLLLKIIEQSERDWF